MSMNGLYDPDISSVGSQCEYYDFWTQLYQSYRVWNSRITVTFSNQATKPFVCLVIANPSGSFTTSTMDEYLMLPCISKVVVGANGSGDNVKTIIREGDIAQTMSRVVSTSPLDVLLKTRTAINSNPSFPLSYVISCNTADGSTLNESVAATIQVEYWADLTAPLSRYAS